MEFSQPQDSGGMEVGQGLTWLLGSNFGFQLWRSARRVAFKFSSASTGVGSAL
jgi:hypothetical protein